MKKRIIAANWKMNPDSLDKAKKIFTFTKKESTKLKKTNVIVCPPFIYLESFKKGGKNLTVGAQDIFWTDKKTSYTGEVSAGMLKKIGVKYVIVGHSERREHIGETNKIVNKKVAYALASGLKVILCVGEKVRDEEGEYLNYIKEEIIEGLSGIPRKLLSNVIIAYEPIWAIGKSGKEADSPEKVFEMAIFIKRMLLPIGGRSVAENTPILYGGSVDSKNAEGFLKEGGISGLLVGHKSLEDDFGGILKISESLPANK